jgi:hypothetical protein
VLVVLRPGPVPCRPVTTRVPVVPAFAVLPPWPVPLRPPLTVVAAVAPIPALAVVVPAVAVPLGPPVTVVPVVPVPLGPPVTVVAAVPVGAAWPVVRARVGVLRLLAAGSAGRNPGAIPVRLADRRGAPGLGPRRLGLERPGARRVDRTGGGLRRCEGRPADPDGFLARRTALHGGDHAATVNRRGDGLAAWRWRGRRVPGTAAAAPPALRLRRLDLDGVQRAEAGDGRVEPVGDRAAERLDQQLAGGHHRRQRGRRQRRHRQGDDHRCTAARRHARRPLRGRRRCPRTRTSLSLLLSDSS